jgi:flagellar hook-associated protein 3 FlgL
MRVSTIQIFNNGVNNMQRVSSLAAQTQNQISTGRKFLSASDDPVAATRILQLTQEIAIREQFQKNITSVTNRLALEETVLTGASELLQRIREITVQAGDGSLNAQDRGFLAQEVDIRLDEMLGLLNSKDANSEFIFAGYKGDTQPFVKGGGGGYKFQGDEGARLVQIGATTFVNSRDSGKGIFEAIPSAEHNFTTTNNPRNSAVPIANITVGQIIDREAFEAFYPEDAFVEIERADALDPPQLNYTVRRSSDNRVISGLQNIPFVPGGSIQFEGISFRIAGVPDVGDSFVIESSSQQSALSTIGRLNDALKNSSDTAEGREQLRVAIESSLNNLDNAQTRLLETRSSIGARLNTLESTQSIHEDIDLVSQDVLSQLQDLDFAEAVSRLSLETFILEAAQQSFAKIANISLISRL